MKKILKVYTDKFGLIKSIPIRSDDHIIEALSELAEVCTITKAYITDGKTSKELNFTLKNKINRPIFYTRSDGVVVHSLSIHPENYPMIATFSNGDTKVISL